MLVFRVLSVGAALLATVTAAASAPRAGTECRGGWCSGVGEGTLTLDASLRVRHLHQAPVRFGVGGSRDDGWTLLRGLFAAQYRRGPWDASAQLSVHAQQGRRGGPGGTDAGALDLQQGWLRWSGRTGTVQIGRQEISYGSSRLLSVRDGPNIRLAFDGVRGRWEHDAWRVDALALRPVENRRGAFDDRSTQGEHLAGIYATRSAQGGEGAPAAQVLDLYLLDHAREDARFAVGTGDERRQSVGMRHAGTQGPWDWNTEVVAQAGDLRMPTRTLSIRAWTLASDTGWQAASLPGTPRFGLKLDVASGDRHADDGQLQTFNALYPRASYFSEAALLAPANLIDLQPGVQLRPGPGWTTEIAWQWAWKQARADAVYLTPTPLTPLAGSAGGARRIGTQIKWETRWQASDHWQWQLHLAWIDAGPALRQAGGRDTRYAAITGAWQW